MPSAFLTGKHYWSILFLMTLLGFGGVWFATPWGGTIHPDSVFYVSVARSLTRGQGFVLSYLRSPEPMTHYPPGYPMLLALMGLAAGDAFAAARWLGAALFALNIFAIGVIAKSNIRRADAALVAPVLALLSLCLLESHVTIASESSFLFFFLVSFGTLMEYLRSPRPRWLMASAGAMALALVTRYAGLPFVFVFAGLVLLSHQLWRRKCVDAVLFGAVSLTFFAAWIVRNKLVAKTAVNRTIAIHFDTSRFFHEMSTTLTGWIFPAKTPTAVEVGVLTLVVALMLAVTVQASRRRHAMTPVVSCPWWRVAGMMSVEARLALACSAAGAGYVAFLYLSIGLVDQATPLDARILSPLFPLFALFLAAFISFAETWAPPRSLVKTAFLLAFASLTLFQCARAARQAMFYRARGGPWINVPRFEASDVIEFVRGLSEGVVVYCNDPNPVFFFDRHVQGHMPRKHSPYSLGKNPDFEAQMQTLIRDVNAGRACVIYFGGLAHNASRLEKDNMFPLPDELTTRWGLRIAVQDALGAAFVGANRQGERPLDGAVREISKKP